MELYQAVTERNQMRLRPPTDPMILQNTVDRVTKKYQETRNEAIRSRRWKSIYHGVSDEPRVYKFVGRWYTGYLLRRRDRDGPFAKAFYDIQRDAWVYLRKVHRWWMLVYGPHEGNTSYLYR